MNIVSGLDNVKRAKKKENQGCPVEIVRKKKNLIDYIY